MKIAAIQMRSGVDIDANINAAADLIRQAADAGATFITTPEMTHMLQRSSKALLAEIATEEADRGVKAFAELAAELGVYLLIGSLAVKTGTGRAINRSYLFGADGGMLARYDKIHLFDVAVSKDETWTESRVYDAGQKPVTAKVGHAMLGMSICYDLRFPELYRYYARAGAQILSVPAAFTRPTGAAHWEILLRARAIETGSYVIAPAQGGTHADGRKTWGQSRIIGPWGEIVAGLDHDDPGFICAEINMDNVAQARRKIPAWAQTEGYET